MEREVGAFPKPRCQLLCNRGHGRPGYQHLGDAHQRLAGRQQLLAPAGEGIKGPDGGKLKTAVSVPPSLPHAHAPHFGHGQHDVGEELEAVAEEGQAKGKGLSGGHALRGRQGRRDGVGAHDAAGVDFGRQQPAGRAGRGVFGRGGGAAVGFGAGSVQHDVGEGVAQVVAGVGAVQVHVAGGGAVEAQVGELEGGHRRFLWRNERISGAAVRVKGVGAAGANQVKYATMRRTTLDHQQIKEGFYGADRTYRARSPGCRRRLGYKRNTHTG